LAENETLNSSPRWQRICRAFRQGETEAQLATRIRKSLYRFVRSSIKNLASQGVTLDDILHAATTCPRDLPELLRRCRQHVFAQLVEENAEMNISRQELLQRVMSDVWLRLADQFGLDVVGCEVWPNYIDTGIVLRGDDPALTRHADPFRRYRREWQDLAVVFQSRGLWWAEMLSSRAVAV